MIPVLAALAALALAGDSAFAKDTGGWSVRSHADDAGCSASTGGPGGTVFAVGLAPDHGFLYALLRLANPGWDWAEDGKAYNVEFRFDRRRSWTIDMLASGSGPGAALSFTHYADDADVRSLIHEVMTSGSVDLRHGATDLGRLPLTGARQAFDQTVACNRSHLTASGGTDPFASGAMVPFH